MPRRTLVQIAAVLLLAMVSTATHAQWTWRDQKGQINASDRPPPRDVPEKDILSRPAPVPVRAAPSAIASSAAVVPAASAPTSALQREVEDRKRVADDEQKAKARAEEERLSTQRAENCRRARSQQAALDSGQRMARMNEKGEREILDDKGRAEEMRLARNVIGSDCR